MREKSVFEIDPGIAFGTGTHPTTALCIELIGRYLRQGNKFLDVGTGSGILMVAAAKLGAGKVAGIDKNIVAVEIARENLRLNRIEKKRFAVKAGNLVDEVQDQFDLVVANILTEVIVVLLDSVKKVLKKTGVFICSGMLEKNTHRVEKKMIASGFEILDMCTKNKWVAFAAKLNYLQPIGYR